MIAEPQTITEAAEPLPPSEAARVQAVFKNAMAEAKAEEAAPEPAPALEKPVEPAKAEPAKDGKVEMPAEVVEGKKADDDLLLKGPPPEHMKGKARESFERQQQQYNERLTKLRAERDEFAEKAKAVAESGDAIKARDAALEAHKAASARAAELEATLERVALKDSAKYQALDKQEQAELETAKSYVVGTEIDPNVIELAARAKGAARLKILREAHVDSETIAAVSPHLAALDRITATKDAELARSHESLAQERAQAEQERSAQEAQMKAEADRVFNDTLTSAKGTLKPFQRVEGNDAWNQQIATLETTAKELFNGKADIVRLADIAVKGVAYDVLDTMVTKQAKQINDLTAELGRLKAAQPSIEKGNTEGAPATPLAPGESGRAAFRHYMGDGQASAQAAIG